MTTKFEIYCGLDTNGHDGVNARGYALNLANDYFPHGHSIREESGRWQTADGVAVNEQTIVISWFASDEQIHSGEAEKRVSRCAADYKFFTYQESVLITRQEVDAIFV